MNGTCALVTGGAGGVGRVVAGALAASGSRAVLLDRDRDALDDAVGALAAAGDPAALALHADVTDRDAVHAAVARAEAEVGPVAVLVNAAGTYGERVPFARADPNRWWDVLSVNVLGPALCTRAVLPGMIERGTGHVICIGSRAAVWDDPAGTSVAYGTSKAALARFAAGVAAEVAGTGVVVVELSPGMVRTGMTATRPDLATLPDASWLPLDRVGAAAVALTSGRYDALHGHFVHAADDLDLLLARVTADPGARRLARTPHGADDPVAGPSGGRDDDGPATIAPQGGLDL